VTAVLRAAVTAGGNRRGPAATAARRADRRDVRLVTPRARIRKGTVSILPTDNIGHVIARRSPPGCAPTRWRRPARPFGKEDRRAAIGEVHGSQIGGLAVEPDGQLAGDRRVADAVEEVPADDLTFAADTRRAVGYACPQAAADQEFAAPALHRIADGVRRIQKSLLLPT
jgi:hypothetical protein